MFVPRLVTFLVITLLGIMAFAPTAMARQSPSVSVDLSVDSTDCGEVALTASVDWKRIRLAATEYMIEWFAVTSFSQTLGTSAFDPGRWADKPRGRLTVATTRDGYLDTSIYGGGSYSALLRVVATGQVVGTSNLVPIAECVQAAPAEVAG